MVLNLSDNRDLHAVVFSKNRAMQLEALLQSIANKADGEVHKLTVVYKSSDSYQESYDILKSQYSMVDFIKENDFEKDIKNAISYPSNYIMFLVDDDVVYDNLSVDPLHFFLNDSNICCFAYRMGLKHDYCYSVHTPIHLRTYTLESIPNDSNTYISWEWNNQAPDFGFPLSVSAHAFRRDLVEEITDNIHFPEPNSFELTLQHNLSRVPPKMASYVNSRIVNNPINNVNSDHNCGWTYSYTAEELNQLFLSGKRIDLDKMDFSNIHQAHQEIKLEFK